LKAKRKGQNGVDMKVSEMFKLHQLSNNDLDLIKSDPYGKGKNFSDLRESHLWDTPNNKTYTRSTINFETQMATKMFERSPPKSEIAYK
jgi:hypothetical protein